MAEGLEHTVISDIITDQNDLVWISVNGTLQLFDGDQFVDMGHLVHTSHANGYFGFESGKDVFFLKHDILYKFTSEQYTSTDAPKYLLPTYSYRHPHPKIIYEDCDFLFISHPNDSLYQIEKETLLLQGTFALSHKPHAFYRWSSIFVSPTPVSAIHYFDSSYHKCTFDLTTGTTSVDLTCPNVGRSALASGDTMLVLKPEVLEIYTPNDKIAIPLPSLAHDFTGEHFLLAGRDSVFVKLQSGIFLFNLRTKTWLTNLQLTSGIPLADFVTRKMHLDNSGHLYITTLNSGLVKMYRSNDGFQYIGVQEDKKYFIKCIRVSEENNLVLAGTLQNGLLVFDTNGILKHHILYDPDSKTNNLISAILKITESRYIVFSEKTYDLTFQGELYVIRELKDMERNWQSYYDNPIEDKSHNRFLVFNHRQILEVSPDGTTPIRVLKELEITNAVAATLSSDRYVVSRYNELVFYNQRLDPHIIKFNVPYFGYSRSIVPYSPGQYLVATDLGIFLLDTANRSTTHSSIYNHLVYSILPGNKKGEFWFSTDRGLYRLDPNMEFKRYSIESGLQENEFNTNSCYKTKSGKLYFGGINGITAFYPEQVQKEEDVPVPYISLLSVNGKIKKRYRSPSESSIITLAYNENVIRIRLLAKGLRSPKSYNFQYKVKELHNAWIDLGRNTDIQLQLPPSMYTIYYHISDNFNPDATTENSIEITILQPIYKRWWFVTAVIALILSMIYYLLESRRKRQAIKVEYALELNRKLQHERMRISRDLHDNIGAQMATVKRNINFLIHHNDRLSAEQAMQKMHHLENISTQINQELRDTIWAVQNEQIDVAGFITRLKNYVFQLLGSESVYRVYYEEKGDTQLVLSPYIALNLHRICQEAINNILKHAEATEIRIIFESKKSVIKITIGDNGKGYDSNLITEGYGLSNIRKRGEQIGAEVYFNRIKEFSSSLEIIVNPTTSRMNK